MLDDADSAEPLRGDSAKRIRSASPVKPIRFVNVFDLLAPVRRASSSIVVRVVRALHLTEVGLAVVPWRRRFPRAALARKASTRRQEATSGSLSWRNRIHPHSAGDGYAAIDIHARPRQRRALDDSTQADAYCRAAFCERRSSNADRHSERHWVRFAKMFSDAASRRKRAYRIASRLKALRLTHRASFEPNSEVRRRRRRRLATTGALPRRWRGSGSRLRRRHECRRP
jgi:hypothetical protein